MVVEGEHCESEPPLRSAMCSTARNPPQLLCNERHSARHANCPCSHLTHLFPRQLSIDLEHTAPRSSISFLGHTLNLSAIRAQHLLDPFHSSSRLPRATFSVSVSVFLELVSFGLQPIWLEVDWLLFGLF